MGNGLFYNMTTPTTRTSGTSKLSVSPIINKFPQMFEFESVVNHLRNHLCYIMRHFGNDGMSVVITREPKADDVTVVFGDWKGNSIELDSVASSKHREHALIFAEQNLITFLQTMRIIKLKQAQFFLAFSDDGLILTDIQISPNKMCGPGMVRDIFEKISKVPEIIKIEALDDRSIECIISGSGNYSGDLIIKPSRFALFNAIQNSLAVPLYAEMKRF
jgi:hypothetical protein